MTRRALVLAVLLALVAPVAVSTQAHAAATSRTVSVVVSKTKVNAGATLKVSGTLSRSPKGTKVVVQHYAAKRWTTLKTTRTTTARGAYAASVTVSDSVSTLRLRVVSGAIASKGLARAASRSVSVAVTTWTQLSSSDGGWVDCGIRSDASLWCWGLYVGDGKYKVRYTPTRVAGSWSKVDAGPFSACGIKKDGSAWCWGADRVLGTGKAPDGSTATKPRRVAGGGRWKSVTVGSNHACGVKTDGSAWCWGGRGNQSGTGCDVNFNVLGDGPWVPSSGAVPTDGSVAVCGGTSTLPNGYAPVRVAGGKAWRSVSAGSDHTCGLTTDGRAWCWGANGRSQTLSGTPSAARGVLGTGTTVSAALPTLVAGGHRWTSVVASAAHTCGITTDGRAWCWGTNANGQLGDGTTKSRLVPTKVRGGSTWRQLALGSTATCGVRTDRTAWCWGSNLFGQLGDDSGWGTGSDEKVKLRKSPVKVVGGGKWLTIAVPGGLGLKSGHTLWRWGSIDTRLEIGDGQWSGSYYVMAVPQRWAV